MNTKHWNIYLLDDEPSRHQLLNDKMARGNNANGLISELNAQASALNSPHRFSDGFGGTSVNDRLTLRPIEDALKDPAGIWLIDMNIPITPYRCKPEMLGGTTGDLGLAQAVMKKLNQYGRPFLTITSASSISQVVLEELQTSFRAKKVTLQTHFDIPGAATAILSLTDEKLMYKRAFDEACVKFQTLDKFHASINSGVPCAMFAHGVIHKLADWDNSYPRHYPTFEVSVIEDTIKAMMGRWKLNLQLLNEFSWGKDRKKYWWLSAAKAINGCSIHRAFLFALDTAKHVAGCNPLSRTRVCDRDMKHQRPFLGILGLQTLISKSTSGFTLTRISNWASGAVSGPAPIRNIRSAGKRPSRPDHRWLRTVTRRVRWLLGSRCC